IAGAPERKNRPMRAPDAATAIGFGDRPPVQAPIFARNWKHVDRAAIVGIADIVVVKCQLEVKGCRWHRKGDKEWLGLPAREWIDKDGNRQFADVIGFVNH